MPELPGAQHRVHRNGHGAELQRRELCERQLDAVGGEQADAFAARDTDALQRVKEGERCDLVDNCNMLLICAREDPATRCAR